MDEFFEPKSVAVVGASRNLSKLGNVVLRNFKESKYGGKLYAVNPKYKEILGCRCFKSVKDIKEVVDLAIIVVPPKVANLVLKECVEKGVKAVVIITAGYKETGEEGRKREKELSEILKKGGGKTRVVGPNCLGIWDANSGVDTLFLPDYKLKRPPNGNISIVSQSGAVGSVIMDVLADMDVGVSKFISYGNAVDVDESDLLLYLKDDEKTKAIAFYMEGAKHGRKFMRAAYETSLVKPIVVLKAGKTERGSKAASSHTGSLAGAYEVYKGVMKQVGIVEALSFEQLLDFSKVLANERPLSNKRIAIVTNGGGFGVLCSDAIEKYKMVLAEFSEESKKELRKLLPSYAKVHNPLDLVGDADVERYSKALRILDKDRNVDGLLIISLLQTAPMESEIVEVLADFRTYSKKPFVSCLTGGAYTRIHVLNMAHDAIAVYPTPERAASALKALYDYGRWLKRKREKGK